MKKLLAAILFVLYPLAAQAATITVRASGGNFNLTQLEAAMQSAACGDIIQIQANVDVTITGSPHTVPVKNCQSNPIVITTDASAGNLPGTGVRTGPQYAQYMARIVQLQQGIQVMEFAPGTNGWIFRHIEFPASPRGYGDVISVGDGLSQFDWEQPHHIIFDRVYVHGLEYTGAKRGMTVSGHHIDIINSYFENFTGIGQDAAPISTINGLGDFLIENNYMEGSGYGFMSGGGDPRNRTHMIVTGSATTTGAVVDTTEAGHTLAELTPRIGRPIAIQTASGLKFAKLASVTGTGVSGSITWTPAISEAPAVGNGVRYDNVPKNMRFLRNYVTKDLGWRDGIIDKPPAPATSTAGTGTVPAGTYYFFVQAYNSLSYTNQSAYSDTSNASTVVTLAAPDMITVSWVNQTGANGMRVWRCTSATDTATCSRRDSAGTATSMADDGTLTWTAATRPNTGTRWVVKAAFEFKVADTLLVEGNIFDGNWGGDGGNGSAFWLKSVNQEGKCWDCYTQDVIIRNNVVRHVPAWLTLSSREIPQGSGYERPRAIERLSITNNLVYDCSQAYSDSVGSREVTHSGPVTDLTIEHNTIACESSSHPTVFYYFADGDTSKGVNVNFLFRYNVGFHNRYGLFGGPSEGTPTLDFYAPNSYTFTQNVVAGANCGIYPATTICTAVATVKGYYVDWGNDFDGGNFTLTGSTPLDNAAPGPSDIGVNMTALTAAQAGGGGGGVTPPNGIKVVR